MDVQAPPLPPMKDLASSDPELRRRTLQRVLTHLRNLPDQHPTQIAVASQPPVITPLQSQQIWLSLFYTVYMHDPRTSAPYSTYHLICSLTTTLLLETIPRNDLNGSGSSSTYRSTSSIQLALASGFWSTIAREWSGIDRHRIDKYLLLMRMMVRAMFGVMWQHQQQQCHRHRQQANDEDAHATAREPDAASSALNDQIGLLARWPLNNGRTDSGDGEGRKVADGIRYHVLDIYVDELQEVLFSDADKDTGGENGDRKDKREEEEENEEEATTRAEFHDETGNRNSDRDKQSEKIAKQELLDMLMQPIHHLATTALTKAVRIRAKAVLADKRLKTWQV